ncbi:MAG: LamG domain-containing protein [Methanomicrobiales archaeon]|nr:LamG domain-containing protein [Methanomicrobiales archaeon]
MTIIPVPWFYRVALIICSVLLITMTAAMAQTAGGDGIEPVAYLNFNEGSGNTALDVSGHGNAGALHNVTRVEGGECGSALIFDQPGNYVRIPYRSTNHPNEAISVSAWFFVDSFERQDLISTCHDGGYCLGFGDGNDLWWTIYVRSNDAVSVNVQHEGITPGRWHHVAGVYDGETSKIYLDGILRNQVNASGPLHYSTPNYVMLGAHAGLYDTPDPTCPNFLHGGLDEVRIYDVAVPYSRIMSDHFQCSHDPVAPVLQELPPEFSAGTCGAHSGELILRSGDRVQRDLAFTDSDMTGTWNIRMPPGSTLTVKGTDLYSRSNPDSWYVEIEDESGRIDRIIAFPNTNNAPADGVIRSGNATVTVRYFDGVERFPSSIALTFTAIAPPPAPPAQPEPFINPIIVIYSASWATLIAIILVIFWLHTRKKERKKQDIGSAPAPEEKED